MQLPRITLKKRAQTQSVQKGRDYDWKTSDNVRNVNVTVVILVENEEIRRDIQRLLKNDQIRRNIQRRLQIHAKTANQNHRPKPEFIFRKNYCVVSALNR